MLADLVSPLPMSRHEVRAQATSMMIIQLSVRMLLPVCTVMCTVICCLLPATYSDPFHCVQFVCPVLHSTVVFVLVVDAVSPDFVVLLIHSLISKFLTSQ